MFTINDTAAKFATFAQAADCAVKHAQQRGSAQVRYQRSGTLLADFRAASDGTVSIFGVCEGKRMVEEWAR